MARANGRSKKVAFREYIEVIGAAALTAIFIRAFILSAYRIPTPAMAPTLAPGDFIFAWKLAYGFELPLTGGLRLAGRSPERGAVVVFRSPANANVSFIKRVIGLPGDAVKIRDGRVYVNDRQIDSLAGETPPAAPFGPVIVEPGRLFMLGDNLGAGDDSRVWGTVPERNLEGRAWLVWLSLDWTRRDRTTTDHFSLPSVRWSRIFQTVR